MLHLLTYIMLSFNLGKVAIEVGDDRPDELEHPRLKLLESFNFIRILKDLLEVWT